MSSPKTAFIVAVVSSLLTAGAVFLVHRGRAREAGRLHWQNNQMRLQVMQRSAETQAGPTTAPAPGAATVAVSAIPPAPASAPASPPRPAAVYHNEGQATPLATLQTLAWACDRGDTDTVGSLLYVDPGARAKAEAYLATLPEDARMQWKSVDDMAAALITHQGMVRPFPDGDILATATSETVGAERIVLHLPGTARDRTEYQKTDAGWKYVITEKMADDYIKRASQPAR